MLQPSAFLWRVWLCLGLALLLVGCGRLLPHANQLTLTTLSDPKTFNYALVQEFPNIGLFAYEGLTRENGITGAIEPALAESWQIAPDHQRITFKLRSGLRWSDGEPLTADDVVFTYDRIIFNPKIPTDASDSLRIGPARQFPQVRKLDQQRVEFILPQPFAPFLRTASGPPTDVAILPKHKLEQAVNTNGTDGNLQFISTWGADTSPTEIVVNGPYRIASYVAGQRMVFERNPYYWRKAEQGQTEHKPRSPNPASGNSLPKIDRIIWQIVESPDTQLLNFRSGDLDVLGDVRPLRPEYFSLLKRESAKRNLRVLNGGPWSGTTFLSFNLNRGKNAQGQPLVDPIKSAWFNSLDFRQAIAFAINRQQMVNSTFRGLGVIQNSPVSVQSPYFAGKGLPTYDYDPDRAEQLLLEAGFYYSPEHKLFDADGHQVRFNLLTNSENKPRVAMGAQIKQDLKAIGIQVDFNPIAFNTLVDKLTVSRDWDAHMIGFTGGVDPYSGANLWLSSGGSHNFNLGPQPGQSPIQDWQVSAWEHQIDRLLQTGAQEFDEAKRKQIYTDFQQVVQAQLPVIYLVNEMALMAVSDRLSGVQYSGLPSWGLWNIAELKLAETDKR
jgi:peptide/nickel transport system substrate-binding protein